MSNPTRAIHQVRCRNPDNKQMWVDIAVLDAMSLIGPNGKQYILYMPQSKCCPYIVDTTGDGNAHDPGQTRMTRGSHMERVEGVDDPTQTFDIEVLDAIAFITPTNFSSDDADPNVTIEDPEDSGLWDGTEVVLVMPAGDSRGIVVDKTGLNLDLNGENKDATRGGHVNLVT